MRDAASVSYSCGPADVPLLGLTIGQMLENIAEAHPHREALVEVATDRRWSFAELRAEAESLALALLARGIQKGDRVGIWSPNCAEWVFTQYASALIGAILVTVNPAYRAHELDYAIKQSGMRLMVSAISFRSSDYASMLEQVGYRDVIFIGSDEWHDAIEKGRDADRGVLAAAAAELAFDEPINIQYTSGTTGFPKGATLSHHNILNNGFFVTEGLNYTEADRLCLPVPLYHCFGMVTGVLGAHSHGACVVLPAPTFDPELTLRAVHDERCTALYGVPAMFIAMLEHPVREGLDLSTLRTGIMAGAPCPAEVMERVIEQLHLSEVTISYGMTETSPGSAQTEVDDDLYTRTQTVGRVLPHTEVKIIDEHGVVVPRGTPGEYCTRGYSVMLGYWEDAEKTAEVLDDARWMHTGDLGVMDELGRLSIVGRIKDMIIRGGENVYPREIEELLHRHPDISDVQVIGVPDRKYGEEIMAWIIMHEGAEPLTAESVREFLSGRITHFKVPRYVHLTESFPATVTGKVRKAEMRDYAIEHLLPAWAE